MSFPSYPLLLHDILESGENIKLGAFLFCGCLWLCHGALHRQLQHPPSPPKPTRPHIPPTKNAKKKTKEKILWLPSHLMMITLLSDNRIMIFLNGLVEKIKHLHFSSQILQICKVLFLKGTYIKFCLCASKSFVYVQNIYNQCKHIRFCSLTMVYT